MSDDCRLCHCCNDAPDRHGEIMSELAAALEQAKADKMAFVDAAAKELATANLQNDELKRQLIAIVDKSPRATYVSRKELEAADPAKFTLVEEPMEGSNIYIKVQQTEKRNYEVAAPQLSPEPGRVSPAPKKDWCSNCGADLGMGEGRSFPYCAFCS